MSVKDDLHCGIKLEEIQLFWRRNNSLKRAKTNISWSFLFCKLGSEILVRKCVQPPYNIKICPQFTKKCQEELKKHHYTVCSQKIIREIALTSEPWSRLI